MSIRKKVLEMQKREKETALKKAVMVFKITCDRCFRLGKEIEKINQKLKELEDG